MLFSHPCDVKPDVGLSSDFPDFAQFMLAHLGIVDAGGDGGFVHGRAGLVRPRPTYSK